MGAARAHIPPDLLHSRSSTDRKPLHPGPPPVDPALDELEQPLLDSIPIVHDHAPAHSDDLIPATDQLEIAPAILLELVARVESRSVELDHETIADEQVDTADSLEPGLGAIRDPPTTEEERGDRLEPRVGVGARIIDERPHPSRNQAPNRGAPGGIELCEVQRGLERDHAGNRAAATKQLGQRARQSVAGRQVVGPSGRGESARCAHGRRSEIVGAADIGEPGGAHGWGPVVHADAVPQGIEAFRRIRRRTQPRCGRRDSYVEHGIVEEPEPVQARDRVRSERTAHARRPDDVGGRVGYGEPATADPRQVTATSSRSDVARCESGRRQGGKRNRSPAVADELGRRDSGAGGGARGS